LNDGGKGIGDFLIHFFISCVAKRSDRAMARVDGNRRGPRKPRL
jgi:hypothetical protein